MSDRDSADDETTEKKKKEPKKTTQLPATKARAVLEFLEEQHWGNRGQNGPMDSVDKIVLAAAYGNLGRRMGPTIKEWTFSPRSPPGREKLVETSNMILALAEQDCDALGRPTTYVVAAYDLARSDRAIGRVLLRISPSGTRGVLEEERYGAVDDEESGTLSTKLLLGLLDSERRDKRWLLEQSMHVLSGAAERDAQRIERMEQIVDGAFAKQVTLLDATEKMLSGAADRKAKIEWENWKKEKLGHAFDKALGVAEMLLPAALAKLPLPAFAASAGAAADVVLRNLISTSSSEQLDKAFGDWDDRQCVRPGILTPDQTMLIVGVANGAIPSTELDKLKPPGGAMMVSSEQLGALVGIFSPEQLRPLRAIFMNTAPTADGPA